MFLLDDMVGFLGEGDFCTFALPFLTKIFHSLDVSVKFFHNDTPGIVSVPYLKEIGVNLYNFSFQHSLQEMKEATGNEIVLLGNIPLIWFKIHRKSFFLVVGECLLVFQQKILLHF